MSSKASEYSGWWSLLHLCFVALILSSNGSLSADSTKTLARTVQHEMFNVLTKEFTCWYPRAIDTVYGGFLSDFNSLWQPEGQQNKMIVTQARHVWSTSNAAMFYQKDNSFKTIAQHGVQYLATTLWDSIYGGFYTYVTREGVPIELSGTSAKTAYGNAFALYGLATYFWATHDTSALELAKRTFRWLEEHSYDPVYGGYFQFLSREGTPYVTGYGVTPPKDYNSSIHLLEAYTALYRVWNDSLLKVRLASLLHIVRDTLCDPRGFLKMFFTREWRHVSFQDSSDEVRKRFAYYDHISFGHDIETAYLLLEASEALYGEYDAITLSVAKKLVDHSTTYGWDTRVGGLFDRGYYFKGQTKPTILQETKEWWGQVEALNSLLLFSTLYPNDPHRYFQQFLAQWEYCKRYLIDSVNGGFYWGGIDREPYHRKGPKASIWKGNYHTSRALINCIQQLRTLSLSYGDARYAPANPNATQEARKLLAFLYSIKGKRIIAGHHNDVRTPDEYPRRLKEITGKRPLLWGADFIHYYLPGNAQAVVDEAYRKYKEGYIITLMWHAGRPQDDPPFGWKESIQAKLTDDEWNELITPGTRLHTRWLAQVDTIAFYLKQLKARGVPVLWRPYHELNGIWFWWGNRKGENGSAKLFRMMYERYVNVHHLDNLLWVWNANAPRQRMNDEAYAYEDYFPGLAYVDVLGSDIYRNDYRQSHHDELVELGKGKIIALAEVGQVPTPKILQRQPYWCWFMVWSFFIESQYNSQEVLRLLYNDPRTITWEEYSASTKTEQR
ncbi:MAG: glycosyl hydrolase [Bacteroidetes bacterium]|nr:glycosyl hydrolase [Bacteroidota bacterium]